MIRRPPRSTRTDTLLPYTTLFRSALGSLIVITNGCRSESCRGLVFMAPPPRESSVPAWSPAARLGPPPCDDGMAGNCQGWCGRSEEHTSELQSLMRISYAVFCLKKKKDPTTDHIHRTQECNQ